MTKDHYIAQTYLKYFGDVLSGGILHAYRKSGKPPFKCWPRDVCHEWDGDLNPAFLPHDPNLLGDFRTMCEPYWNPSIESLLLGKISDQEKFVVSAYFALLMTCTPPWRRIDVAIYNKQFAGNLSFARKMKEKHGAQPDLPVEAIEMLERGEIALSIDPDYIKAVVTRQLLEHACIAYNQDWTLLSNDTNQPFVTSDNPVAFLHSGIVGEPTTRFLPITPSLCLSLTYDISRIKSVDPQNPSFDFLKPPLGKIKYEKVNTAGAKCVNRQIAMCAEEMIFSSVASSGLEALVKKYAKYRIEAEYVELPADEEDSIYQLSRLRVREQL
jgi:Protein of unknown function (DUF4238)